MGKSEKKKKLQLPQASESDKSYPTKGKKSSSKSSPEKIESLGKANKAREEIVRKAKAVPIDKVAASLKLKEGESARCPCCGDKKLELDCERGRFCCGSCGEKGDSVALVKHAKPCAYWAAIWYLQELADSTQESPACREPVSAVPAPDSELKEESGESRLPNPPEIESSEIAPTHRANAGDCAGEATAATEISSETSGEAEEAGVICPACHAIDSLAPGREKGILRCAECGAETGKGKTEPKASGETAGNFPPLAEVPAADTEPQSEFLAAATRPSTESPGESPAAATSRPTLQSEHSAGETDDPEAGAVAEHGIPDRPRTAAPKSHLIPEEEIERVKREVDLLILVQESGVKLKRHGQDWVGLCPFHNDTSPSLVITPEKNLWHCLGACNRGGSNIDWVMCDRHLSFRAAFFYLRERCPGIPARETDRPAPVSPSAIVSAADQELLKRVIRHYHETLKKTPAALAYLEKRGLKCRDLIDTFQVGFADKSIFSLLPHAGTEEGREMREGLERVGILTASGREHLHGCLVVPILERDGTVTGAYGRKVRDNLPAGTARHLYLPGRHRGIFNPHCLDCKEVILNEAIIDAMTWWRYGHHNVTSGFGTNGFTDELVEELIAHGVELVFHSQDADDAGERSAKDVTRRLSPHGIECFRVQLPLGMDVNEFALKYTPAEASLADLLKTAKRMGNGKTGIIVPSSVAAKEEISLLAAKEKTAEKKNAGSPNRIDVRVEIKGEESQISIEDRLYRVLGLGKNRSYESLKVNLWAMRDDRMHVDSIELFNARQRAHFARTAAQELGLSFEAIESDMKRILLKLEAMQAQQIEEAVKPKPKQPEMSEKERDEAMALLLDPDLLDRIAEDFKTCGLVGEEENCRLTYLTYTSSLLDDPLAELIQALSGAGKTALMDAGLAFMPPERVVRYTGVSGQCLYYFGEDDLVHKILAVSEDEGAEDATYPLKILQSEKKLLKASTVKDPKTGRFSALDYQVNGPAAIVLSTTREVVDQELLNRFFVLTSNQGQEQTREIQRRQREKDTLEDILKERERERIRKRHQNAQRLLRPLKVVNPYARHLTFPDSQLRTRRDHLKYLTLIRTIAFLHQYQRQVKEKEGVEYIEVTLKDIDTANQLVSHVLGTSLDELAPQTRKLLGIISHMVGESCEKEHVERGKYRFTRREVREYTGWHNNEVKRHLDQLVDFEYLLVHKGSWGRQFIYELVYRGEGKEEERFLPGLVDVEDLRNKEERGEL